MVFRKEGLIIGVAGVDKLRDNFDFAEAEAN